MSIGTFVTPANGFSSREIAVLTQWCADLGSDDALKLIQRNFDRECLRKDIPSVTLRDFLRDVAAGYSGSSDPLDVIDQVLRNNRPAYAVPGSRLAAASNLNVSRVVRADQLLKHHFLKLPVPTNLKNFVSGLQNGTFVASDMVGSQMGRADLPIWVCRADILPTTADTCRDERGLKHIDRGHLIELNYPVRLTPKGLHAPTTLDGCANSADNWIFAKRGVTGGGPDWGHTVNLATSKPGVDEAVHNSFTIDASNVGKITLKYIGPITCSAPSIDFTNLQSSI
jgi:hypothetical protein